MFLTEKDIVQKTGLSRTTIRRLEKAGRFPKRLLVSERSVRWRFEDVQNWMNSQKEDLRGTK